VQVQSGKQFHTVDELFQQLSARDIRAALHDAK
jgi:hypothetical protein